MSYYKLEIEICIASDETYVKKLRAIALASKQTRGPKDTLPTGQSYQYHSCYTPWKSWITSQSRRLTKTDQSLHKIGMLSSQTILNCDIVHEDYVWHDSIIKLSKLSAKPIFMTMKMVLNLAE